MGSLTNHGLISLNPSGSKPCGSGTGDLAFGQGDGVRGGPSSVGLGALPILPGAERGEVRDHPNSTSPAAGQEKAEPVYLPGPVPGFRGASRKMFFL